ncbi:GntR family transcriptional regulator [Streptomyces sp. NPDC021098]|uniref:GntR family transcriptional regulator n=1 Tax=unclassified Streptomyces TaxID=2593676 RepID=UPI0037A1C852
MTSWSAATTTPSSSTDEAYLRIRERLLSGVLPPGTQLSERQLAAELSVSRTPVREALTRLERDGLVLRGRGGVVVAGLSAAEVRHVYQCREVLEGLAAELAAARSRDGELPRVQLTELTERAQAVQASSAEGDQRGASAANLRFHQWICELAANPYLADALNRLWDRIEVSSLSNLIADPAWSEEVHGHHQELCRAITEGDPEAAAVAARHHIHRAAEVYSGSHPQPER